MAGRRGPRSVFEEPGFTAGRLALVPDTKRWDEFWRTVEWALALDPAGFDQVPGLNLWVIVSEPSPGTGFPYLRVFYSFDDDYIYLKWVELA